MEITDVRIRKIATEGKMKAIVSITFDNEFVVHDIKVIEGQSGLFIAMPSRKTPDGEFKDIAHPINTQTREKIQTAILDEYEKVRNEEPVTRVVKKVVEKTEEKTEKVLEV
ncbi:septation regulator SpoVG [Clostridium estertheticum]|uniref:septation regulator SpoVG n=1 Tax=Clostridium estertheticum TaxID=238834 RepID=UPI001CF39A70|nr:septation regulator SpoVG [Clostridium estertheticum]MCB2307805.1 septation regulator SpoVG [Clostridium estertheticum]MCB2345413.1 septation regulator SpoVG [Clostridium estertheticum]MCB2350739.1 septation regulator SpoVG [Clostridium estertheticum]WAG47106.1 septation regulator SpoVG [Clostridium estertheticum]